MKTTGVETKSKKNWRLTQGSFRGLLGWLDEGADSGGERYLEVRRRLVAYFDRKSCLTPDELADETLNRVARRLEEEGSIKCEGPAHYCYIVARYVFLEYLRGPETEVFADQRSAKPTLSRSLPVSTPDEDVNEKERRSDCLSRCIKTLDPDQRDLIIGYYTGEQRAKIDNRRSIARRLGISVNALSIRACRIRDRLEHCARNCLDGK